MARGLFKRHREFKGKFVHSDWSFIEWVLHMGISRKSDLAKRIPQINRTLCDLKAEGFWEKALKKYTEAP